MSSVAPEVLFFSLLLGAGLGIIFTAFEMFRIVLMLRRWVTFLMDVLFCAVCSAVSFLLALGVSGGVMRFWQLGCEGLGFACVYVTLTYAVRRFLPKILRALRRVGEKARRRGDAVGKKFRRKKPERKPCAENKRRFFRLSSKKSEKKT